MLNASQSRQLLIAFLIGAMLLLNVFLGFLSPLASDQIKSAYVAKYDQQNFSAFLAFLAYLEVIIEMHEKLLIVLSTMAIAFFTATLYRATSGLLDAAEQQKTDMRESLAIAKQSADAAERQSKAAIATELPILRIVDLKLAEFDRSGKAVEGNDPVPAGELSGLYRILVCYKNVGRTIATVNQVVVEYRVTQFLPEEPQFRDIWFIWLPSDIEPQASSWMQWSEPLDLSPEQKVSIKTGNDLLWIYGCMKYTDFMGDSHESRFVGLWTARPKQPQENGIVFGVGLPQYKTNT